jgi:hypothetical protein
MAEQPWTEPRPHGPWNGEKPFHAAFNGAGSTYTHQALKEYAPTEIGDLAAAPAGYQYRIEALLIYSSGNVTMTFTDGSAAVLGPLIFPTGVQQLLFGTHLDKPRSGCAVGAAKALKFTTAAGWTGRLDLFGYLVPVV